ncbi:hypothetical protein [Paraburkholderia sp. D1E]|uniref:hypothetical protein n=1 Tax=Paraburkholderia sp. D1E TaxID=3461398 RepID=UPI0040454D7F
MKSNRRLINWCLAGALLAGLIRPALPRDVPPASQTPISMDVSGVMKPLQEDDIQRCGLHLRYPALKNFFDQEIRPGCPASYKANSTTLGMSYEYGAYPDEPMKSIDISIYPIGLDTFLDQTSPHHSSTLAPTENGWRLQQNAGFGNKCNNLLRTEITPISGANWHGWLAEEVYGKSRSVKAQCKFLSPEYRCVSLVIGNRKMSAESGSRCLLKKITTNLEEGLSFDFFMQMIRSIRFNEE